MKGGNTFWIIWGGVLVLWLVLRYFAKQRMHPVPGMETQTYKKAQMYSVFGTGIGGVFRSTRTGNVSGL